MEWSVSSAINTWLCILHVTQVLGHMHTKYRPHSQSFGWSYVHSQKSLGNHTFFVGVFTTSCWDKQCDFVFVFVWPWWTWEANWSATLIHTCILELVNQCTKPIYIRFPWHCSGQSCQALPTLSSETPSQESKLDSLACWRIHLLHGEKRDLDVQWEMLGTQVCSQNTSHQPQSL